ncbi:MAG: hypothetical protein ABSD41_05475 [Candidatus Bathyarchaeia archaeon]|jgi:predicted amidophosphoribosyltransferase
MELTEEEQIQLWIEDHQRMFCPVCGRDSAYNASYCDKCGTKLRSRLMSSEGVFNIPKND